MKTIVFWLPVLAVMVSWSDAQADENRQRLIVCSTTQTADFARQIVGERWEVRCVLAAGQDPHLYQVTPDDAQLISQADLCIENGWHLEGKDWMRTLAVESGKRLVTCTDGVEPLDLEADDNGNKVKDPHAWFSPINARIYARNILFGICEEDPEHADEYRARFGLYRDQLRTLDRWIVRQCNQLPANRRVLVTSHDAFNYFCKQYGFESSAPAGWSTGAEIGAGITPERRRKTVQSIRDFGVKAIFVETSVNKSLIREIAKEAGVEVGAELYSDSMGTAGSAGETYVGMMRENVLRIVYALQ